MTPDDGHGAYTPKDRTGSLVERAISAKRRDMPESGAGITAVDRVKVNSNAPAPADKGPGKDAIVTRSLEEGPHSVRAEAGAIGNVAPDHDARISKGKTDRSSKVVNIDFDNLRDEGINSPKGPRSRLAEEFRMIKRNLLQRFSAARESGDRIPNLVMVTSAVPSEGKTFTAINLALSIASEPDLNVLLIDADLIRPNVFRMLGIESGLGLTDVINNPDQELSELIVRTDFDGLSLLGAGAPQSMATELLASSRMREFTNEISRRYNDRIIIFDAPPVLATSEPAVLAHHMDQVVFVVEAERTPKSHISEALDIIGTKPEVGIVLNKARSQFGVRRFGSYHRYYAG